MSQLPLDLLLTAEGHLTDVALATLADGEESLLPENVIEHANHCESCASALHDAALASVAMGEVVRAAHAAPSTASEAPLPIAARIPWLGIAAGLALSVLGLVLGEGGTAFAVGDRLHDARALGGVFFRVGRAAVRADLPPMVSFFTAAILVAFALVVMRKTPLSRPKVS